MRPKERIIPFLEAIKGNFINIIYDIYKIGNGDQTEWNTLYDDKDTNLADFYYDSESEVEKFWLENPDLRFSQVLVILGIIPNIPGFWYYMEEDEILKQLNKEQ